MLKYWPVLFVLFLLSFAAYGEKVILYESLPRGLSTFSLDAVLPALLP